MSPNTLPDGYARTLRALIRFAVVMTILTLLVGLAYRESTKKLDYTMAPPGLHLEAVLGLGLVHGHFALLGVVLPLCFGGALLLGLKAGGRAISPRTLRVALWHYVPAASLSLALQLYAGYHVLLAVRGGDHDLGAIEARLLGGSDVLRYALYGVAHGGMGVGLGILAIGLWRSLR
jgi:hypothetical protein